MEAGDSCSVSLRVLSGAPPPVWRAPHAVASAALAPADDSATQPQESAAVGYAGFDVTCGTQRTRVFGARAVEEVLLASAPAGLLAPQVERHVAARIAAGPGPALAPSQQALLPSPASPNCTVPIRGPADWEAVKYAPQTDDCGCFSGDNTPANNCYAYGTDVCTNTFPQPGRGSGQKWSEDTCDDIRASSERDGLVWAGTDLPKTGPEDGESHYVSLHIWDKTNFHWLRMVRVYRRRACRARVCSAKLLASLTRETAHARKPRMCVPPSSLCSFAHRSACLLCGVGVLSRASCLSRCLSA